MKIVNYLKNLIKTWKENRRYKRRLKELKKRDPFTYKNF